MRKQSRRENRKQNVEIEIQKNKKMVGSAIYIYI